MLVCLFVFNVPPTAKVVWGRGHGLKSHPTDHWRSRGPLVYKASGLSTSFYRVYNKFNPYKPNILFNGHMQTVKSLIRRRIMRRLSRLFTICLQYILLKSEEKMKNTTNTPKVGNGIVLVIGDASQAYLSFSFF